MVNRYEAIEELMRHLQTPTEFPVHASSEAQDAWMSLQELEAEIAGYFVGGQTPGTMPLRQLRDVRERIAADRNVRHSFPEQSQDLMQWLDAILASGRS